MFELEVELHAKPVVQRSCHCDSLELLKMLLVDSVRDCLDRFNPLKSLVTVKEDTHDLVPKITYRCAHPQCRAKLFEAWGTVKGINIVCRKCKRLCVPVRGR